MWMTFKYCMMLKFWATGWDQEYSETCLERLPSAWMSRKSGLSRQVVVLDGSSLHGIQWWIEVFANWNMVFPDRFYCILLSLRADIHLSCWANYIYPTILQRRELNTVVIPNSPAPSRDNWTTSHAAISLGVITYPCFNILTSMAKW